MVADLIPGPGSGSYYTNQLFHSVGGKAFFPYVTPGSSTELGVSDGTVAGTRLVKDLWPGSGFIFGGFYPMDGYLFYVTGGMLAYSDGNAATTHPVQAGPNTNFGISFYKPKRVGNVIFFQSTEGLNSLELFGIQVDGDGDGVIEYFDPLNFRSDCPCTVTFAPCGNDDPNAGCRNSTGQGARLDASGTTILSNDDLVLTTSQLPSHANGLMFMGTGAVAPVPFQDGVRCVGGSTVRWQPKNSGPMGTMSYGPGLAAQAAGSFPSLFHFAAGSTWRFQTWYRNNAGPCGLGSNLSNSATVVFTP
jgi:ELWxxDGT repeat protein